MWPKLLFGGALAAIVLMRLPLLDSHLAFGSDMGSYLMTKNWLLGLDPNGIQLAHFRPPLFGVLLIPFTQIWGDLMGSKILFLLLSVTPAIGMYYLARQLFNPWWSVLAAVLLVVSPANARLTALNQISLPALALALWGLGTLVRIDRGQGQWWALALPIWLIAGLNQSVLGVMAILIIIAIPISAQRKTMLKRGLLAGLMALSWMGFYQQNIPIVSGLYLPGAGLVFNASTFFTVTPFAVMLVSVAFMPRSLVLWAVSIAVLILPLFGSPEVVSNAVRDRAHIFIAPLIILAGLLVLSYTGGLFLGCRGGRLYEVLRAAFIALVLAAFGVAQWQPTFHGWAGEFDFVTANTLPALEWVKANTPANARIMAHPDALGWYVGGYAQRRWAGTTGRGQPLKAFEGLDAAFTCTMGWREDCDPLALKAEQGIDFVMVDRNSWQSVNDDGKGWDGVGALPWLFKRAEFGFGSVRIYEILP